MSQPLPDGKKLETVASVQSQSTISGATKSEVAPHMVDLKRKEPSIDEQVELVRRLFRVRIHGQARCAQRINSGLVCRPQLMAVRTRQSTVLRVVCQSMFLINTDSLRFSSLAGIHGRHHLVRSHC